MTKYQIEKLYRLMLLDLCTVERIIVKTFKSDTAGVVLSNN